MEETKRKSAQFQEDTWKAIQSLRIDKGLRSVDATVQHILVENKLLIEQLRLCREDNLRLLEQLR